MRITRRQLRSIIKEELIREAGFGDVRVDDLRREQRDALLSDAREQFDEWKTNVEVRVRRVPNPAYKVWLDSDVLERRGVQIPKMFIEKNFSAPYLTMNQLIGSLTTLDSSFTTGKFINIPEPERSQLVGEISEIPNEIDLTKILSANIDGYWHTNLRALPSTELKVSGQNLNEALTECLEPAFKKMLFSYAKIINMLIRFPEGEREFRINPGIFSREMQATPEMIRFNQILTMKDVRVTVTNAMASGGQLTPRSPGGGFAYRMINSLMDALNRQIQAKTVAKFSKILD